jgi:hypothetical protein
VIALFCPHCELSLGDRDGWWLRTDIPPVRWFFPITSVFTQLLAAFGGMILTAAVVGNAVYLLSGGGFWHGEGWSASGLIFASSGVLWMSLFIPIHLMGRRSEGRRIGFLRELLQGLAVIGTFGLLVTICLVCVSLVSWVRG